MLPIAIFRFSPTEGPAYFAQWLDRHALPWKLVAIDEGAPVPADPQGYSGIAMMGGAMGVNDGLPWIAPLTGLLRDAVARQVPVIGHCLGGQLLAKALGAPVSRAPSAELGWVDVAVSDERARRDWFSGRASFTSFQWHYDAFAVPETAIGVATSDTGPSQAFIVDDRHIGMQFHVEMTRDLIDSWLATGSAELPSQSSVARQSAADIRTGIASHLDELSAVADGIYARWSAGLRR